MSSRALHAGLLACACLVAAVGRAEEPTALHQRVDALINAAAVGPTASAASDADFLRRVSLDLTGVIPTAEEARAFLTDSSPDKRARLIDQLLASPLYARNMTLVFDVMLMERRPDKAVKTAEWQAYLYKSFAENKRLDELCREIIAADGSDAALRPSVRFLLDRDCEPNAVTRDTGRMLFGMDLQCAQCHDHPTIDAYLQEDYYGLYAFFLRSSIFTDTKANQTLVAEKADGEANFKSVFTSNAADRVSPRLPHGELAPLEPVFAKGEEYVVAPAKEVRPVPKHSRRGQLASLLSASPQFRLNLANRVWSHLFGRGLVHPLDGHHVDNPPTHPAVLNLLAEELARNGYDLKALLRELTQTQAYQRSCDPQPPALVAAPEAGDFKAGTAALESQRPDLERRIAEHKSSLEKAQSEYRTAQQENLKRQLALAPLEAEVLAASDARDKAIAAMKQAEEALAKKLQQATAIAEAAKKADEAAQLLADDKLVVEAAAALLSRSQAVAADVETARKAATDLTSQLTASNARLSAANQAVAQARGSLLSAEHLSTLERTALQHQAELLRHRYDLASLETRISLGNSIARFQDLSKTDSNAANDAWTELVAGWTSAAQIARVRPLSCEQFAMSLLQATGVMAQRSQTARENLEKMPPQVLQEAAEADRPQILARLVEEQTFEQLRGNLAAFTSLYETRFGEDFQATVNQALFFENAAAMQSLLGPSGGNLADRLTKMEDPASLAEELYLSTLTRFPTDDERNDVVLHLQQRFADRPTAVGEIIWALLSSNEFRFNH